MVWFVAGLLFALFNAGTMLVNQKYKLDGSLIAGMRGVGVALIYSPAALFVPFPKSHLFWWLIVAEGLLSAFFSSRLYSASLYVPDPAYLSALTLTSPLWIMLYNACFGIRDVVEKRWVVAMLLSLCALMFFAQMPLSSPSEIPAAAGHRG